MQKFCGAKGRQGANETDPPLRTDSAEPYTITQEKWIVDRRGLHGADLAEVVLAPRGWRRGRVRAHTHTLFQVVDQLQSFVRRNCKNYGANSEIVIQHENVLTKICKIF